MCIYVALVAQWESSNPAAMNIDDRIKCIICERETFAWSKKVNDNRQTARQFRMCVVVFICLGFFVYVSLALCMWFVIVFAMTHNWVSTNKQQTYEHIWLVVNKREYCCSHTVLLLTTHKSIHQLAILVRKHHRGRHSQTNTVIFANKSEYWLAWSWYGKQ